MVDLSSLSNEELLALRSSASGTSESPTTPGIKRVTVDTGQIGKPADLSSMSNEDLLALRDKMSPVTRAVDAAIGLGRAVDSGLARGVAGMGGFVGDMMDLTGAGLSAARNAYERATGQPESPPLDRSQTPFSVIPTSAQMRDAIEKDFYNGQKLYEPQNKAEEYARTAGEFLPNAIGGAGRRLVQRAGQVLLPAAVSETAGQVTKGTAAEPYARFVGALAGGGASALLSRPGTASRALKAQLPEGITAQHVYQAEALINSAKAQGIDLAWPEALSQVAGRPVFTNTMRHLEASPQTESQMAQFFGDRPQQIESAARNQFGNLAPVNPAPSTIGPAVGRAAEETVGDVRGAINKTAKPFYDSSEAVRLSAQDMARVRSLPGFEDAAKAVRSDPQLNRYVSHLPDDSVGFLNEVKKELYRAEKAAVGPLNAQPNMQRAAGLGSDASAVKNAAVNASTDYGTALAVESVAREKYLQPLLDGPLGKLAAKDTATKDAINALFPKNPLPNSEHEIGVAVSALSKRNPSAARDLVRAHVESVFNEAARDLQSGANQAGGAKFRAQLIGNPQQRSNLREAVEALPNGQDRWNGFNKFLDILEATGTRPNVGSRTAYNQELLKQQATGGLFGDTIKTGANPARFGQKFIDRYEQYKLGKNLGQLADILTDPRSGDLLRSIAKSPVGSNQAQVAAFRLITYWQASRTQPDQKSGK